MFKGKVGSVLFKEQERQQNQEKGPAHGSQQNAQPHFLKTNALARAWGPWFLSVPMATIGLETAHSREGTHPGRHCRQGLGLNGGPAQPGPAL